MTNNGTIQIKGEVVSTKPKWDRHEKDVVGVVIKADNKPYWFRWSQERGKLNVGDAIEITANVKGVGEARGKSKDPMTFLNRVAMVGAAVCGHAVVTTQDGEYYCDSCGEPMTVAATASIETPSQ